ncbi:MAG: hypothetical protein ABR503_15950 [Chitinophagaceae bacterium]
MKTQLVIAELSGEPPLKIVHADLIKTYSVLAVASINLHQKNSPYFKKFFEVTPAVQEETNWDNEWFNSYE